MRFEIARYGLRQKQKEKKHHQRGHRHFFFQSPMLVNERTYRSVAACNFAEDVEHSRWHFFEEDQLLDFNTDARLLSNVTVTLISIVELNYQHTHKQSHMKKERT